MQHTTLSSDKLHRHNYYVSTGRSYPLGATCDEQGVNFALFSANATKVELCIFSPQTDNAPALEIARITLPEFTDDIWHGHISGITAGCYYGYRVHGPFEPTQGHRFNPHKLLLDPYAKQIAGQFIPSDRHYSFDIKHNEKDLTLNQQDNAQYLPKCVVTSPLPNSNSHLQIKRRDTIIYELHVKGFTKLHPDVPSKLQGTFSGLSSKAVCDYLTNLGITSVELLPIHQFVDEPFVHKKGLTNYWGYNSIGFFLPHQAYSESDARAEFKQMVETFHQAGIEVILDVVYNHSAEGNELGPTYSFKGIDNASYYRLQNTNKRYYENHSGCGNTFNIQHPRVLQMVLDSLRYWVSEMGVDGFRFDLAPILGREELAFNSKSTFFNAVRQDPILAKIKLIAEPWDIGENGYQLGQFPKSWLEWNDKFRDICRQFWRGDKGLVPEFARRLHGSSDLFEQPSRRPSASINFITSHDGFTLDDLVSFEHKHNQANNEHNLDGHNSNFSANYGEEGASSNSAVNQLRDQQKRNLLTSLFIAQGTPMLLSGDEHANSQQGNNNAYCQDNETTWINWQYANTANNKAETAFVSSLIALRKAHPLLNRTNYQHGVKTSSKTGLSDISWLNCHGHSMTENDWHNNRLKCFAMLLSNTENTDLQDDALLIIFNAHANDINFQLPALNGHWNKLIDTTSATINDEKQQPTFDANSLLINVSAHSCTLLSFIQESAAIELSQNLPQASALQQIKSIES